MFLLVLYLFTDISYFIMESIGILDPTIYFDFISYTIQGLMTPLKSGQKHGIFMH